VAFSAATFGEQDFAGQRATSRAVFRAMSHSVTRFVFVAAMVAAAAASSACQDAASKKKIDDLSARVEKLEKGGGAAGGGSVDTRLAKVEKFLGPYMNQPPPPPEPDPKATYSVPIEGDPTKGPATAPVTLVEAFDFACPYCYRANPTVTQLLKDYDGKLRVAYKMFIVHPQTATLPAYAACAAAQQGKYAEFEHELWEQGFSKGGYSEELIDKLVKELKLDATKFKADKDGDHCKKVIGEDMAVLQKLGMNGTPGFFVNGRFVGGAQPIEVFKKLIDEELKKADEKIAAGTPAADYYAKFVVEQGIKELEQPKAEAPKP
jgi:protein-disulfide isomerase